jgi:HlyD family secretion protein
VIAGTTNLPGTVLMRIADLSRMRVRAEVDETDVLRVQSGQPARIYLQSGDREPISGSVDRIAPTGKKEGEVVSFETLIAIEGEHGALRGGMTCTVEIEVRRSDDALSVPIQAVVHRRRKDLPDTPGLRDWAEQQARSPGEKAREAEARYIKVLFVMAEGVARACPVDTGLSDERRIEILSILKPGDSKPGKLRLKEQVIVGPFRALDELKDRQRVTPVTATSDETSEESS